MNDTNTNNKSQVTQETQQSQQIHQSTVTAQPSSGSVQNDTKNQPASASVKDSPDKNKIQSASATLPELDASMAVTKRDVENVVSSWTSIPISKLTEDESAKLLGLEKRIHMRLIDQEEAVAKVSEAVRRGRIGLASGQRPTASFIFLGPSGTGKTELAKTLAEILFGRDDAMVRLDMSEYMEKHEVAKIIGAPPGYVGYEEGGQLTEAVRAKPYSIVLLDEVEKAHPDVFNILLQLLEDGRLTDNKGNIISFKNTIVICTSNIGSGMISEKLSQEDTKIQQTAAQYAKQYAELSAVVNNELRKFFRPELLNRFDDIVIFKPLHRSDMLGIAKLSIEKTAKLLKEQGFSVSITDRALSKLAKEGYDPMYGARPLRRLIQNSLENPIALEIIGKKYVIGDTIAIDYKGDTNAYSFGKPAQKPNDETAQQKNNIPNDEAGSAKLGQMSVQPGQAANTTQVNNPMKKDQAYIGNTKQVYYGEQVPQNNTQVPQMPQPASVTDFDPLSVLSAVEQQGELSQQGHIQPDTSANPSLPGMASASAQPSYPIAPPTTGAYISGQDAVGSTARFQQGAANELQSVPVLQNGELTASGIGALNEEQ